jgi:small neutral amino acid transporter SnatA (MarC family)
MNPDMISNFVIAMLAIVNPVVKIPLWCAVFYDDNRSRIQKITGDLPLNPVSRIFGMILIAIGVQFMVVGLTEVFPGWASSRYYNFNLS